MTLVAQSCKKVPKSKCHWATWGALGALGWRPGCSTEWLRVYNSCSPVYNREVCGHEFYLQKPSIDVICPLCQKTAKRKESSFLTISAIFRKHSYMHTKTMPADRPIVNWAAPQAPKGPQRTTNGTQGRPNRSPWDTKANPNETKNTSMAPEGNPKEPKTAQVRPRPSHRTPKGAPMAPRWTQGLSFPSVLIDLAGASSGSQDGIQRRPKGQHVTM